MIKVCKKIKNNNNDFKDVIDSLELKIMDIINNKQCNDINLLKNSVNMIKSNYNIVDEEKINNINEDLK